MSRKWYNYLFTVKDQPRGDVDVDEAEEFVPDIFDGADPQQRLAAEDAERQPALEAEEVPAEPFMAVPAPAPVQARPEPRPTVVAATPLKSVERPVTTAAAPVVTTATKSKVSMSPIKSLEEVYAAAGINHPTHGFTILKIADMLQSDHVRNMPAEMKRSSILLALEASGAKLQDAIEDAVRRTRALDQQERLHQKALEELENQKNHENRQIQAELDRLIEQHRARIQANNDEIARERAHFYSWRLRKKQEEGRITDALGYFVSDSNPLTQAAAASAGSDS